MSAASVRVGSPSTRLAKTERPMDLLRLPKNDREVPGNMFGSGSERLFCLLQDDSPIHKFSVEAIQSPGSPPDYSVRLRATVEPRDGTHGALAAFR